MSGTVRYRGSSDPLSTDGRDIDRDVAELSGEAADQQASGSADEHLKQEMKVWRQLPMPQPGDPTYYDVPMLNEPVWEWAIPTYYYIGGLTGAALVLSAAAQVDGRRSREKLIRRCRWIGLTGAAMSGGLLIYDLGMPSRFINMLRVFRPTSVMNMGAWILSGTGGTAFLSLALSGRRKRFGVIGEACGYLAGIFGAGLATYTGVLTGNTAVPVWQASRKVLPILFGTSAMSSVGALFDLTVEKAEERRLTKIFGTTGQVAELVSSIVMEKQAAMVPRVARPLKKGFSGFLWRTAMVLTGTGLVLGLIPKPSRGRRLAAGIIGTLGSGLMRASVEHIGVGSSRDARASFQQQRAGYGAAEATKA
jgi:formate-dependent nitrite reductase membrane component NrfD